MAVPAVRVQVTEDGAAQLRPGTSCRSFVSAPPCASKFSLRRITPRTNPPARSAVSDTVWVAAQGPLWNAGGDRGLYKTTDGGKTWKAVLTISENTGVTDVVMDPRDPDVLYAASYQRRRHVWTLINGGPEATIYKTVDGGANWKKIESGLPREEKGRIGLAIAPSEPDTVYALVEAARGAGGFFRSEDGGQSWTHVGGLREHPSRPTWQPGAGGLMAHSIVPHPTDPARMWVGISAVGVRRTAEEVAVIVRIAAATMSALPLGTTASTLRRRSGAQPNSVSVRDVSDADVPMSTPTVTMTTLCFFQSS